MDDGSPNNIVLRSSGLMCVTRHLRAVVSKQLLTSIVESGSRF